MEGSYTTAPYFIVDLTSDMYAAFLQSRGQHYSFLCSKSNVVFNFFAALDIWVVSSYDICRFKHGLF